MEKYKNRSKYNNKECHYSGDSFKTLLCVTFLCCGYCPFYDRCLFIHDENFKNKEVSRIPKNHYHMLKNNKPKYGKEDVFYYSQMKPLKSGETRNHYYVDYLGMDFPYMEKEKQGIKMLKNLSKFLEASNNNNLDKFNIKDSKLAIHFKNKDDDQKDNIKQEIHVKENTSHKLSSKKCNLKRHSIFIDKIRCKLTDEYLLTRESPNGVCNVEHII